MNSWDDPGFRKAIEATGRKNILMTGLWTEVCITWPAAFMVPRSICKYRPVRAASVTSGRFRVRRSRGRRAAT